VVWGGGGIRAFGRVFLNRMFLKMKFRGIRGFQMGRDFALIF
jgi:hypothetical protein